MTTAVTVSRIRELVFENVYDKLTASLSAGTVTAAFIDDIQTFPQVVINPATISVDNLVLNRGTKMYNAEVEIEIFSKKNKQIDTITDEIITDFTASESSYRTANMYLQDIEDTTEETVIWNNTKVHMKSILVNFQLNL
jgi:hypothetical protein